MVSEAPPFWWEAADWRAAGLLPFAKLYGSVATRRMDAAARKKVDAPVLCVGNPTVGGAGKTPVAIALGRAAKAAGRRPGFLSRGHGGSSRRPHLVDSGHDSARLVGDEPLLLAEHAPVAVTPDRAAGARLLIEAGCDFLIMDDGFQSARIHFDYALLVVDGRRGIGNGHVLPAGPLRAPFAEQLRHADALLKMGDGNGADALIRQTARAGKPVIEATAIPRDAGRVAGRRFLAFAGIGDPDKFFATVREAGGDVVLSRGFPDHYPYPESDLAELSASAHGEGLELITTAKDAVRLRHGTQAAQAFTRELHVLEIEAVFESPAAPRRIIAETIDAFRRRKAAG